MKRLCVFAGSNLGAHPAYQSQARALGEHIAHEGLELVYGGSRIGLMGEVANAVLQEGGTVIGVMPQGLFRGEFVHSGLTELIEVKDMHERKAVMGDLADAYIALPGGYGTLEELFEVVSWAQLGIHRKPVGLFNIDAFYQPLLDMIDHAVRAGFIQAVHQHLLLSANDGQELLQRLKEYQPVTAAKKWDQLDRTDTE